MSFKFICPICNAELDCDDSLENQITECPSCQSEIVPVKDTETDVPKAIPVTTPAVKVKTKAEKQNKTEKKKTPQDGSQKNFENDIVGFIDRQASIQSDDEFKRPLLSRIFRILGWIYIACAIASLTIGFLVAMFALFMSGNETSGVPFVVGIAIAICLLINGFISFGSSQLIDFIGKICFNSDKILEIIQRQDRCNQK